ncbi:MAG: hypothetical protein HY892_02025 [Deltaproteobacteria bacterium]|nr:hypothetical protein [Deltaproteobacteria bacterium]
MNYVSTIGNMLRSGYKEEYGPGLQVGQREQGEELQPGRTGSSFQDIFSLVDANTDLNLGADELGLITHLFLEGLVLSRDKNGDGGLSAEEAGVSAELVSEVDTDQNARLDGSELNTMADEMLGGIIKALDKNEDNALSMKELALLFFLFGANQPAGPEQVEPENHEPEEVPEPEAEPVQRRGKA